MRCFICDKQLKPEEIKTHPELKTFEPCAECLEIISEVFEDGLEEEEITKAVEKEWSEDYYDKKVLDNSS